MNIHPYRCDDLSKSYEVVRETSACGYRRIVATNAYV